MALELQNDEQQRVMSDNLSISASNRLAAGNLSTQKSVQRVTDDVGAGIDGSGVAKSLTKGYSVAKGVKAAGVGTFLSGEAGRTAQFASEKAQPLRDAVSAVRGFTPSAVTGEAAASDSVAATAKWLPGNNFEKIASRPFVNNDFASAAKGVTPEAGIAPSLAVAGDDAAMSVGDMASAGGKLLGVAGGAYDAVEDIAHGGIYGANDYEKASNVLTIASTVLDFVPGMEWLGVAGSVAATALGAKGSAEEDTAQSASNAQQGRADAAPGEKAANITVSQRSAPDASRAGAMPSSNTF